MGRLDGKVALVTGASRGIGRATAERLAEDGALVAVHYGHNAALAEDVVAGIIVKGGDAFAVRADLALPTGVSALFDQMDRELIRRTGDNRFDILVNNAAVGPFVEFEKTDEETFDEVFNVNVKSLFFITQKALGRMRDGGRIINLSSVVTRVFVDGLPAYSASKGAIDALTLQLAPLAGKREITVNAVAPGPTETDMAAWMRTPEGEATLKQIQVLPRKGQPEDIARVVGFLASPDGAWLTGRVIDASGGLKL